MTSPTIDQPLERTRLLLNIVIFLKNHDGILLSELSRHFSVSDEEMRELLLGELILSGVPPYSPSDYFLVFLRSGPDGERVKLHLAEEFRQPLKLTMPEALSLKAMLQSYSRGLDPEVQPVADSLLEKVVDAMQLPEELARQPANVALARHSVHLKQHLTLVDSALRMRRVLRIEYFSSAYGELMTRDVEPLDLFEESSRFYLRAWCRLRKAERSFRIDRIRDIEMLKGEYRRGSRRGSKARAVPGWDGSKAKGKLIVRFEPAVAEEVESEWVPRGGRVKREKDGSLILTLPLYSEAWALGWVLGFGVQAELLEPSHLRDQLVERIKRMVKGRNSH